MEALIAANANKGATAMDDMNALHFAAQKGHTGTSQILLKNGGSLLSLSHLDLLRDARCVLSRLLVPKLYTYESLAGVSVSAKTRKGQTALHIAVAKGEMWSLRGLPTEVNQP